MGNVEISDPAKCLTLAALDYQVSTREDASLVPLGPSEFPSCFLHHRPWDLPTDPSINNCSKVDPGISPSYQLTDTLLCGSPAPTPILAAISMRDTLRIEDENGSLIFVNVLRMNCPHHNVLVADQIRLVDAKASCRSSVYSRDLDQVPVNTKSSDR